MPAQGTAGIGLHEHVVLDKFEGDDQTRPPLATIEIDDGVVTAECEHEWLQAPTWASYAASCVHCGKEHNGTY